MNCNDYGPLLSSYIDGELNGHDRRTVEEHVRTCPFCKREMEQLQSVKKLLSLSPRNEPRPFFETRVMSLIRERTYLPGSIRGFVSVAGRALFVGAVIMFAIIGANSLRAPQFLSHPQTLFEEYLLSGSKNNIEKNIYLSNEVSEQDILTTAFDKEA